MIVVFSTSPFGHLVAAVIFFVLMLPVAIFGGGALLYVGARKVAKIPGVGYWRSVGVHLLAGLVGGASGIIPILAGLLGAALITKGDPPLLLIDLAGVATCIVATWVFIKVQFHTTFWKAVLAWLPTFGQGVMMAVLLIAILVLTESAGKEMARRAACKANISSIGIAINIYTSGNVEPWPPDLSYLIRAGQQPGIFICPGTGNRPGAGKFDYFYLPVDPNAPPWTIVLCDYRNNHPRFGGYRNILFADTHVGGATEEDFQRMLADPNNAAFAKALRAAEGP